MEDRVPENLYKGELISYPGPWSFQLGRSHIILVSDEELKRLSDPDAILNMTLTFDKNEDSLRGVCEKAQQRGDRTLIIAFDHFFAQYRPGQTGPREFTPDKDEYIERIAKIGEFAAQYGLGLELSLINPLEIGPAYQKATGESGKWMHYRKGLRDPQTGAYSVQLWRQQRWANNKGVIEIEDAGIRVFAFRERKVHGSPYMSVNPEEIVDISDTAKVEVFEGMTPGPTGGDYAAVRIRIYGTGHPELKDLDKVIVVQQYRTPEMDYFSEKAYPFIQTMLDKYAKAGVKLNALYSDEMHIQQDWGYFTHHDNGEFALRYVSDGFAKEFAKRYGNQYLDFAKYLVYFTYGQEDIVNDLSAKEGRMHVFDPTFNGIAQTALFRARYYHLLQDGVVDLCAKGRRYTEKLMGHSIEARAHATWAESPTCDRWRNGKAYEYTPDFIWSVTVHQAAAAAYDYFKWGDYLTGNGNDHSEGGWLDRDYYGLALGCSLGVINEIPYAYAAHWGSPHEIASRHGNIQNTFGTAASPLYNMVQDMQHRDVDVLMLYPLDLTAVEERFGSWMTQYGYANYISQAKLIEMGKVVDGKIEIAGRRYTTLVTLFEPFPSKKLLSMMKELAEQGGKVVWSSIPPMLNTDGEMAFDEWGSIFGVRYEPYSLSLPGQMVKFEGALASVTPQMILSDFLVDYAYPVWPIDGVSEAVAKVGKFTVGTYRAYPSGGSATFIGMRPRDDQSASLGYETRQWFEILSAVGAYPETGKFSGWNDNTEVISRYSPYLACRFPNGTIAIARHIKDIDEAWPGGFARNREEDVKVLEGLDLPADEVHLENFKVNGHEVTYHGASSVAFRVNDQGDLIAFSGSGDGYITVDGRKFTYADGRTGLLAWAPVQPERRVEGGAVVVALAHWIGELRIPTKGLNLPAEVEVVAQGEKPGSRGEVVSSKIENDMLVLNITQEVANCWLYVVPKAN